MKERQKDYYEGGDYGYDRVYESAEIAALQEGLQEISDNVLGIYEVLLEMFTTIQKTEQAVVKGNARPFKVGAEMEKGKQGTKEDLIAKIFGNQ